eukprot:2134691-Pyramimonas_sp.AAC.1
MDDPLAAARMDDALAAARMDDTLPCLGYGPLSVIIVTSLISFIIIIIILFLSIALRHQWFMPTSRGIDSTAN